MQCQSSAFNGDLEIDLEASLRMTAIAASVKLTANAATSSGARLSVICCISYLISAGDGIGILALGQEVQRAEK